MLFFRLNFPQGVVTLLQQLIEIIILTFSAPQWDFQAFSYCDADPGTGEIFVFINYFFAADRLNEHIPYCSLSFCYWILLTIPSRPFSDLHVNCEKVYSRLHLTLHPINVWLSIRMLLRLSAHSVYTSQICLFNSNYARSATLLSWNAVIIYFLFLLEAHNFGFQSNINLASILKLQKLWI